MSWFKDIFKSDTDTVHHGAEDKSRRTRWCSTCDLYRQTYEMEAETDAGKMYHELCLHCDTICDTNTRPRSPLL